MRLLPQPGSAPKLMPVMPGGEGSLPAREQSLPDLSGIATRLRFRDESALAELYDLYSGRAFGLANRILEDGAAAEDAVHDSFLWMWEHADRVDAQRGSVGALLLTVVHRRAVDQVRRRSRRSATDSGERDFPDIADESALDVLSELDQAQAAERVRAAVNGLNADQREAVELAYFKGMTHQQIARARQLPIGTVKSRLRLAMGRLRAALKDEAR